MSTLPADVLLLIFPRLVQRDLLECMTVCKPWRKVIKHHVLFRDIHIHSQKHLDILVRRVIRDPTLGAKVDRLTLNFKIEKGFDEMMLVELFPNVREFRLINKDTDKPGEASFEIHENHPWCDRIEKLMDTTPCNNTKALLESGLCKNLTHLSLLGSIHLPNADELFDLLDNTPALTTLELRAFHVTCHDLELLHSVVPAISSILLKKCLINCSSFPLNVEPATSVKSFRTFDSESDTFAEHDQYIRYIAAKYSHLEDLAYELIEFDNEDEERMEAEARFKSTLLSYIRELGSRLKSLSLTAIDYDYDISASFDFAMLDDCGCNIEKLELNHTTYISTLELLSRSNQANSIQSLTLARMCHNPGSTSENISLQWIAGFKKLKELSLHFSYPDFYSGKKYKLNLPDLFDPLAETQVEILQLKNVELHVNIGVNPRIYPFVKDLYLHEVEFQWHTDVYIAKLLPNIKRLTLDSCLKDRRLFSFPNLKLSYFQISQVAIGNPLRVLVITTDDVQQRLYTVNRKPEIIGFDKRVELKDFFSLPPVTSEPYEDSANFPIVTIMCKSLTHFFMMRSLYF